MRKSCGCRSDGKEKRRVINKRHTRKNRKANTRGMLKAIRKPAAREIGLITTPSKNRQGTNGSTREGRNNFITVKSP